MAGKRGRPMSSICLQAWEAHFLLFLPKCLYRPLPGLKCLPRQEIWDLGMGAGDSNFKPVLCKDVLNQLYTTVSAPISARCRPHVWIDLGTPRLIAWLWLSPDSCIRHVYILDHRVRQDSPSLLKKGSMMDQSQEYQESLILLSVVLHVRVQCAANHFTQKQFWMSRE